MRILLAGATGFIGLHVAQRLLERGDEAVGIDNLNDYYDPKLKLACIRMPEAIVRLSFCADGYCRLRRFVQPVRCRELCAGHPSRCTGRGASLVKQPAGLSGRIRQCA